MALDSRKPRLHEPCKMPLMIPRDRAGQDSIASAAPAGHSAPMPMPSRARNRKRKPKVGEKPAMKLQTEYQAIESINGVLRPTRSASQPDPHAPTRRIQSVIVKTAATSVRETPNSLEIGTMISRNTVKSNASSVQPSQAAHHAIHWSLVGSFHQGRLLVGPTVVALVIPPCVSDEENTCPVTGEAGLDWMPRWGAEAAWRPGMRRTAACGLPRPGGLGQGLGTVY